MATLIRSNGTTETVTPANGRHFSLGEMQAFVGGFIEHVGIWQGHSYWCNEEGKLLGLPVNAEATARLGMTWDVLVGDVLVTSETEVE